MSRYAIGERVRVITDRFGPYQKGLEGHINSRYETTNPVQFTIVVQGTRPDGRAFEYCYTDRDVEKIDLTPFEASLREYIDGELGLS